MVWDNLIIDDKLNIPGKGTILVVDLQKSGVVKNKLMHECPVNIGDMIIDKEKKYRVRGLEMAKVAMDFYENIKSNVGIQVIEL